MLFGLCIFPKCDRNLKRELCELCFGRLGYWCGVYRYSRTDIDHSPTLQNCHCSQGVTNCSVIVSGEACIRLCGLLGTVLPIPDQSIK